MNSVHSVQLIRNCVRILYAGLGPNHNLPGQPVAVSFARQAPMAVVLRAGTRVDRVVETAVAAGAEDHGSFYRDKGVSASSDACNCGIYGAFCFGPSTASETGEPAA